MMKKQLIMLIILFMGFLVQASMYERMKGAAKEKYETAKEKAKGFTKGLTQEYAPNIQQFAKEFIEKTALSTIQLAVKSVVKNALLHDTIDNLANGVPFGNELVDQIRTTYMTKYFPEYTKTITTDSSGNKIVKWIAKGKPQEKFDLEQPGQPAPSGESPAGGESAPMNEENKESASSTM